MSLYTASEQLQEMSYLENYDDESFIDDLSRFFGSEFVENDDILEANDFKNRMDHERLEKNIKYLMRNWK